MKPLTRKQIEQNETDELYVQEWTERALGEVIFCAEVRHTVRALAALTCGNSWIIHQELMALIDIFTEQTVQ